ncbi:hypothetical protein AJ87_47275 [Rhizobium yanglingense]|nr:hypothetical protein AJ87_47275 [Rhizobium yanglingense]
MATEAAIEKRTRFDLLGAAGIHVAGKKEDACHACWCLGGKYQSDAGAVTPADEGSLVEGKVVHHSHDVRSHEFIGIWPVIAGAAAVPATIDRHDTVARRYQGRHLISPIAAVAESAVQQDDGRTAAK